MVAAMGTNHGLIAPILMPGIRLDKDAEAETALALKRAGEPWVGGFCLFGGHAEDVARLTEALHERAGRRLRIASDMERGAGQQVQGLPDSPDLGVLGLAADPRHVHALARATARDARSVGVDIVFGPVLDVRSEPTNPIVGTRSFGWNPDQVAQLGVAYVQGLHAGGVLAVAKHFPGHGATREDSHEALPVVEDDERRLELRDLLPFRTVVEAGCRGVMTGHLSVPALDPSGRAATFSEEIVDRLRAWDGGDDVLVFTDALLMAGALNVGTEAEAARQAAEAGCDALLYPNEPERVAHEFFDVPAARRVRLVERAQQAAKRWERSEQHSATDPERETFSVALSVARAALSRAGVRPFPEVADLLIIDDDAERGCGAVLAAAADAAGVSWERYSPTHDANPPDSPQSGAVAIVFARARGWKGCAGISEAGLAAARRWQDAGASVVWCAPVRGGPGPLIPGGGTAIETALAEALFRAS